MTEQPAAERSPYLGLRPFEVGDQLFFFGREADVSMLAANLRTARVSVLYGASGVGKSSLLGAGLAPRLVERSFAAACDPHGEEETTAPVVLSLKHADPTEEITQRLVRAARAGSSEKVADLEARGSLLETIEAASRHVDRVLIVLDQFEEYLAYARDAHDDTFGPDFARILRRRTLPVHFMIAMREDTLAALDHFRGQVDDLFANPVRLSPLTSVGAKVAITEPLRRAREVWGLKAGIEPELVPELIEATRPRELERHFGGLIGDAPTIARERDEVEISYLQLALQRLWEAEQQEGSTQLRQRTFARLGGIPGIVRRHLDEIMDRFSGREQEIAADCFRSLVSPSGLKVPSSAYDLAVLTLHDEAGIEDVLGRLAEPDVRILKPVGVSPRGDQLYELFHDRLGQPMLDWRSRHLAQRSRTLGSRRAAVATAVLSGLALLVAMAIIGFTESSWLLLLVTVFAGASATLVLERVVVRLDPVGRADPREIR